MKRGLAFALAALALVAGNTAVQAADIDLSLNLRYTHPNKPEQGGTWYLLAKTNTANANTGIAGLSVYLSNINTTGIVWGNGTALGGYPVVTGGTLGANVQATGNVPFNFVSGGVVNAVYGQDLVTKTLTIGEGAGTPGILNDPLKNTAWNNSALIMSGSFAGGGNAGNQFNRPAFASSGGNSTDGNVFNGAGVAVDATVSLTVRGDSVNTLNIEAPAGAEGLRLGDANRDGTVNLLTDIFPSLAAVNAGTGKTWAQGDFNGDGSVNLLTDIFPSLAGVNQPQLPNNISAVPEPATAALMVVGFAGLAAARRRK